MSKLRLFSASVAFFCAPLCAASSAFARSPLFVPSEVPSGVSASTAASVRDLSKFFAAPSPEWIKAAAIYEASLRAFPGDGKLFTLEDRLMKLRNSGFDAVCLPPLFAIGDDNRQSPSGDLRAVRDFSALNYEFGTKDALKSLVLQAEYAAQKIILTWPVGTTSRDHAWIKEKPDWYIKDSSGGILLKEGEPELAWLDMANGDLRAELLKRMAEWAGYGVDGFKFDGADLAPAEFWAEARRALKAARRDFVLIGVTENPELHLQGFDATLSRRISARLKSFAAGESGPEALERFLKEEEGGYPQNAVHVRFIEELYGERSARTYGAAHRAVAALNVSLPGATWVVTGQEAAFEDPVPRRGKPASDWKRADEETMKFYKKLLKLRQKHPALSRGQMFRVPVPEGSNVWAYARTYRDDAVFVVLNFSDREFNGTLEVPAVFRSDKGKPQLKPVLSGARFDGERLRLPPWGAEIFEHD